MSEKSSGSVHSSEADGSSEEWSWDSLGSSEESDGSSDDGFSDGGGDDGSGGSSSSSSGDGFLYKVVMACAMYHDNSDVFPPVARGKRDDFPFVQVLGDQSGGLECVLQEKSDPGDVYYLLSNIFGDFDIPAVFSFEFDAGSAPGLISIVRLIVVQNIGSVPILVGLDVVAPGDELVIEESAEAASWSAKTVIFNVQMD